ncbi:HupE/UreJ family protein [Lysobacter capsici]|uniref:HupE/UreJ family protein n=1 Tax=Lysobacter capsici TaxID=435897 RepID=UPI001C000125|nr:HupE/UreJ family protein [Lysobacter capsici]QWF19551.1 HupE/UreJ family protein [Lysobacter capsici]
MSAARFNAPHLHALTALSLSLFAGDAAAHSGTGLAGGFASGFAHPFGGGDHLLAMVCVGIWGALLGPPLRYALPVVFPLLMVAGAVAGMFALPMPPVEFGIALSVLVLGGCIATAWRAPPWLAIAIVSLFAVFHGYAHGRELPSAADPVGYSLGFVFATGLLHVLGIGLGEGALRKGHVWLIRALGAAIGLVGAFYLWSAIIA